MSGERILIVDDEKEISELVRLYLEREGYEVLVAGTGQQALDLAFAQNPDLIILDIVLPDLDGYTVCRELRTRSTAPIIFLSCKDQNLDKILGLEIGGDDYLTKPFDPAELAARVKASLRRVRLDRSYRNQILQFPGLEINLDFCSVKSGSASVALSAREFQILALLAQNANRVFSAEQIYRLVWHDSYPIDWRMVPVHISNLRKKIEPDPSSPRYILTVKGLGYKFNGSPGQGSDNYGPVDKQALPGEKSSWKKP
ncbi:MAG: response regulator transcription factor [Firmicutes bacterium]|jgi:DNA-binding response OmpR family regulator|nr:response regulator transcription factor [Bacillota bacterium]HHX74470.1 response regulator transcription factor [Bacillota bacterium]HOA36244.1 response regulator transcription factor [Bacillota bacterium]